MMWEILGIEPTTDQKVIKHAYATKLREAKINGTGNIPELREALDDALRYAENDGEPDFDFDFGFDFDFDEDEDEEADSDETDSETDFDFDFDSDFDEDEVSDEADSDEASDEAADSVITDEVVVDADATETTVVDETSELVVNKPMFNTTIPEVQVVTTSDWKLESVEQQAGQDFTMKWQYAHVASTQSGDWERKEADTSQDDMDFEDHENQLETENDDRITTGEWAIFIGFIILTLLLCVVAFIINIFFGIAVTLFMIIGYLMWSNDRFSGITFSVIYLLLLIGIPILFLLTW